MPYLNNDVFDYGLNVFVSTANAGNLRMALCAGNPANFSEVNNLYPTGKRISDLVAFNSGDVTLSNVSGGRAANFPAKSGTAQASVTGADLTVALVDVTTGSERLLAVLEETTDQPITSGNTINFPAFNISITMPL